MTATTATTVTSDAPRTADAAVSPVRVGRAADDETIALWAGYVDRAPGATLFHHPLWSRAVQTSFGHRPCHLLAMRSDAAVGVLPLMEVRSRLAGRLFVSVPYGTYGGILCDDDEVRDVLAAEAARMVRSQGGRSLELRSADAHVPYFINDERYCGFVRELPRTLEELETFLPRKARAAARQALRREKLTVEHDDDALRSVWRLYAAGMRRLGSINYPYRFFEELVRLLGPRAWVTVVRKQERPIAGLLSFVFGETVMPYFMGSDERARCTGSTNVLYRAVMERAVRAGLRRFDFGRTRRDNRGPFEFKCNQGFEPRTLGYQRYLPAGKSAPNLTPSNPRFALPRRIWRHLPLAVTSRLGGWLAKSIPG